MVPCVFPPKYLNCASSSRLRAARCGVAGAGRAVAGPTLGLRCPGLGWAGLGWPVAAITDAANVR